MIVGFDREITVSHNRRSLLYNERQFEFHLIALNEVWLKKEVADVIKFGKPIESNGGVYKDYSASDGEIEINDLVFKVSDGKVESVSYLSP